MSVSERDRRVIAELERQFRLRPRALLSEARFRATGRPVPARHRSGSPAGTLTGFAFLEVVALVVVLFRAAPLLAAQIANSAGGWPWDLALLP